MFPFLDLPQELRNRVYDFVIPLGGVPYHVVRSEDDSIQPTDVAPPRCADCTGRIKPRKVYHPYGLAFANKFLSQEFLTHTYANALFTFYICETGVHDFYATWRVSPSVLSQIAHCAFAADLSRISPAGVVEASTDGSCTCDGGDVTVEGLVSLHVS